MRKINFAVRRLVLMILLMVMVVSVAACGSGGGGETNPEPTSSALPTDATTQTPGNNGETPVVSVKPTTAPTVVPTVKPTATAGTVSTGNAKPNVITADNKYANVKIYDKFGKWPVKSGKEYYGSQVGTWFTIWWVENDSSTKAFYNLHWFQECRLKPVDYGYYSANDKDYLTSVFARLKYMDIDFILLDDTNGHWADNQLIARNMLTCFKVAKSLNGFAPQIAIATGQPLREGDNATQQKEFDEYYKIYNRYKDANVFYCYEGKPLLVNYIAEKANARYADNQNRFTIRYGTGLISWQNKASNQSIFKTQGNWGWVYDNQNKDSEIMGVQPGYNKPGMESAVIKRQGGKHYIEQWLAAIKANPKVIMIPSYNDHCEETGWEATKPVKNASAGLDQVPSGEDPYLYEKITEAYLALRYGYIDGFFYQVEGTSQVYKYTGGALKKVDASAAGKNPIILLPKGYIEWEKSR